MHAHAMRPSPPLARVGWRSYLWAALAIARKDWLHFWRYPLNALFRVIEPIVWLMPIYFMGKSFAAGGNVGFAAYTGTADYMAFILIGTVLSNFVSAVFWGMGFSLKQEMDSGVLESNWLMPVPRPLFIVGQTVASVTIVTINSIGVLALGWFFFGVTLGGNLLAVLSIVMPMLVALYGFGFAFAALVMLMRDANTLVDVSNFLVTGLSGSQFPIQVLPRFIIPVSLAIPLTYGYDAVRGVLLGTRTILPIQTEIAILVACMGLMLALGYTVFARVERRCRQLGTIGLH